MSRFAILLGGGLTVTPRLRRQLSGSRFIAADSGMMHASSLRVTPELWIGDFDSSGSELTIQYRDVPRETFPKAKDATDGALAIAAALARGASEIVLVGALGGQMDHALGLLAQGLGLVNSGYRCHLTSGVEEAWPMIPGELFLDLEHGARLSLVALAAIEGLDLEGVKWPLAGRSVPLGSTLTLSNVVTGPVRIAFRSGYGAVIAYPQYSTDD